MSQSETRRDYFERSIETLFLLGQLPVIFVTYLFIVIIDKIHAAAAGTWYKSFFLIAGLCAIATSLGALLWRKKHKNNAVFLLTLSLFFTLAYLACLMMITGGRKSPFMHLFLYLPVVVFMVAERRVWAEILAGLGAFLCFCWTYNPKDAWDPWNGFILVKYYQCYEKIFILILLVLLILVNHHVEKIVKETMPYKSESEA